MAEVNANYHRQTVIKEHYVIVGEPNGFYLSHVMPEDGTGYKIATSVYSAIKDTALEQKLKIVGSDGTTVMTGKSKEFIASSETLIGRPLQWVICLLHLNKLCLRHVFQNLDGVTSEPDSFSGPIGRQLNGAVFEWKVEKFKFIPNPKFPVIPNSLMDDLSSDQYYAYRICSAVMLESVDVNLEFLEVGGLNHLRWLTLGLRILRFYVAREKPTSNLSTLAEFLIKVYFFGWFQIKFNNKITGGPRNYLDILTQVMGFPNKIMQNIAVAVLQRNAYFAHHENILLAILADNNYNVRLLAVNKILIIRVFKKNLDNVVRDEEVDARKFIIPKINTNAKTYCSLSSLSLEDMHEPPALNHLLNKEIEVFQQHKLNLKHSCHNQAVERHIKLVLKLQQLLLDSKLEMDLSDSKYH